MKSFPLPCVVRDGPYLLSSGVRARLISPLLLAVHGGGGDDLRSDGLRRCGGGVGRRLRHVALDDAARRRGPAGVVRRRSDGRRDWRPRRRRHYRPDRRCRRRRRDYGSNRRSWRNYRPNCGPCRRDGSRRHNHRRRICRRVSQENTGADTGLWGLKLCSIRFTISLSTRFWVNKEWIRSLFFKYLRLVLGSILDNHRVSACMRAWLFIIHLGHKKLINKKVGDLNSWHR